MNSEEARNASGNMLFRYSPLLLIPYKFTRTQAESFILRHYSSLPRLPLPPLQQTLERYLLSVRPFLKDEGYRRTEQCVKEFGAPGGIGERLHALLEKREKETENWLAEWWLKAAYLESRLPLPVYSNPALYFQSLPYTDVDDCLMSATKFVVKCMHYKEVVESCRFPQEMMNGHPLDMIDHFNIFTTCRIPAIGCDTNFIFRGKQNPFKHIVVVHNNSFFQVDVIDSDGNILSQGQLLGMLKEVVHQSQQKAVPVGILTALSRDKWAEFYEDLCTDSKNKSSIEAIHKALFVLNLDEDVSELENEDSEVIPILNAIHGCGYHKNTGNRWFDKCQQVIYGKGGAAGMCFEHSIIDSSPLDVLIQFHLEESVKSEGSHHLATHVQPPRPLEFNLSSKTLHGIKYGEKEINKLVTELEVTTFKYRNIGKEFLKSQEISPDSFIQLALQLAFFRLHGYLPATYEPATTRKFHRGRTETIKSATNDSLDFCRQMSNADKSTESKVVALRKASNTHKINTQLAINGLGVDRYLLGLKRTAAENGMAVPDLFLDEGYQVSTHYCLSTTQKPVLTPSFFAPVVSDGYGCWYNAYSSYLHFAVTAFRSCSKTSASQFRDALQETLADMQRLFPKCPQEQVTVAASH